MGDNTFSNDSNPREMFFVVNGEDGSSELLIKGYRCRDYCDVDPPEPDPDPVDDPTLWSDPATWTNVFDEERLPEVGDEVTILLGMKVVYDIGESPVLKNLAIDGDLTFLSGQDAKIRA